MTLKDFLKDKHICIISAHPDDIELGMGGTLNQIKEEFISPIIMSDSRDIPGNSNILEDCDNSMGVFDMAYTCQYIPTRHFLENTDRIRDLVFAFNGFDVYFTHSKYSQHIDHRIIGEAVDDIIKDKTIITWEEVHSGKNIPTNMWNEISVEDLATKSRALNCYKSQKHRIYFEGDHVITMARYRGNQILKPYSEAFNIVRLVT